MRAVADTNIIVSGLLWHGPPRQVLDAARSGGVALFTTGAMLAELEEVLRRPKFAALIEQAGVTPDSLVAGYAALATLCRRPRLKPSSPRTPTTTKYWLALFLGKPK